jgi:hypothetical protein
MHDFRLRRAGGIAAPRKSGSDSKESGSDGIGAHHDLPDLF